VQARFIDAKKNRRHDMASVPVRRSRQAGEGVYRPTSPRISALVSLISCSAVDSQLPQQLATPSESRSASTDPMPALTACLI
jgi:hypothetical protein